MSKLTFFPAVFTKHVLTLCHRVMYKDATAMPCVVYKDAIAILCVVYKDAIAMPCVVRGSRILTFSFTTYYTFVSCFVSLITSRLLTA